jgi:predicted DNA-binding protein
MTSEPAASADNLQAAFDRSERVEIEPPEAKSLASVLSVRMSRDLLKELTEAARSVGKGPATLARELIEQGLVEDFAASPALIGRVLSRLLTQLGPVAQASFISSGGVVPSRQGARGSALLGEVA